MENASKYTTAAYSKLVSSPFKKTKIKPLRTGDLGSEYNSYIADYETEAISIQGRSMEPYIASDTHGSGIYNGLKTLLRDFNPSSVLDLGCGAGELLSIVREECSNADLFGVTIHYGEVLKAKELYNIDIAPIDMREINKYFKKDSLDLIVIHCAFNFIPQKERLSVANKAINLLKTNGSLLIVNYKNKQEETGLNSELPGTIKTNIVAGFMGEAFLYKKI